MAGIPRLVISAPHGRSGKTTLSLGLAAAFCQRTGNTLFSSREDGGLFVFYVKKGP